MPSKAIASAASTPAPTTTSPSRSCRRCCTNGLPRSSRTALPSRAGRESSIIRRASALLARVGGDPILFRDVIELFLDDCPNQLDAIRQAIHDQHADRIYRAAHKLKGSAGNFDAHEIMALLQRLEARARDGDLATCVSVFVEIEAEAERLMAALALASTSGEVCAS